MDRFSNPVGTNLAFVTTFGDVTLSLTEDGTRMLMWNSETGGELVFFVPQRAKHDDKQNYRAPWSSTTVSLRLQFFIPQRTLTRFSFQAAKAPYSCGTSVLRESHNPTSSLDSCFIPFVRVCIHKYDSANLSDASTANSRSPITALVQSPAIDVVGMGFASGEISIYDVRADERLMRIYMEGGGIRSLAFRTGAFFDFYLPFF